MTAELALSPSFEPGFRRLAALAELNDSEIEVLRHAASLRRSVAATREIMAEHSATPPPGILLSGWAARIRSFADGRRQILSCLLPGDLISTSHHSAVAPHKVFAITDVTWCSAPQPEADRGGRGLAQAYAASDALEQAYLNRQIARLGRLNAHERLIDWLIEIHDRLELAGLVTDDAFPFSLTQEIVADTLGLTAVHVNRTLQAMRRDGLVEIGKGKAKLLQPERLRYLVDYPGR